MDFHEKKMGSSLMEASEPPQEIQDNDVWTRKPQNIVTPGSAVF